MRGGTAIAALTGVLLAGSLAITGCTSTSGDSKNSAVKQADSKVVAPSAPARDGSAQDGTAKFKPGQSDRATSDVKRVDLAPHQVIRTAELTLRTEDVPGALERARTTVEGAGGYLANETTDQGRSSHEQSRLTLRVPARSYQDVLDRLGDLGKLVERQVSAKDVTDQVVDVTSRVASQKASVARIRALMDQADKLSDVVTLEGELSTRQANLEALEAQQTSLKGQTDLATITLVLQDPDAGSAGKDKDDDGAGFGDALSGGWHAFTTAVRWVALVVAAVLPFAALAGLLFLLWRVIRKRLPERLVRAPRAAGGPDLFEVLGEDPPAPDGGAAAGEKPARAEKSERPGSTEDAG